MHQPTRRPSAGTDIPSWTRTRRFDSLIVDSPGRATSTLARPPTIPHTPSNALLARAGELETAASCRRRAAGIDIGSIAIPVDRRWPLHRRGAAVALMAQLKARRVRRRTRSGRRERRGGVVASRQRWADPKNRTRMSGRPDGGRCRPAIAPESASPIGASRAGPRHGRTHQIPRPSGRVSGIWSRKTPSTAPERRGADRTVSIACSSKPRCLEWPGTRRRADIRAKAPMLDELEAASTAPAARRHGGDRDLRLRDRDPPGWTFEPGHVR